MAAPLGVTLGLEPVNRYESHLVNTCEQAKHLKALIDREGVRIAVSGRSAYGLWLADNIQHAELVEAKGLEGSFETFVEQKLDALSGLRPRLITDVEPHGDPGSGDLRLYVGWPEIECQSTALGDSIAAVVVRSADEVSAEMMKSGLSNSTDECDVD